MRSNSLTAAANVGGFQLRLDQRFLEQSHGPIEGLAGNGRGPVDVPNLVVGKTRGAAQQRADELGLVVDQPRHIDRGEIRGNRVGFEHFAVEVEYDVRYGAETADFLVKATRYGSPERVAKASRPLGPHP
ncbi:MAG: hypothetical protein R6X03_05560 [Methyloceanibacter sp.]